MTYQGCQGLKHHSRSLLMRAYMDDLAAVHSLSPMHAFGALKRYVAACATLLTCCWLMTCNLLTFHQRSKVTARPVGLDAGVQAPGSDRSVWPGPGQRLADRGHILLYSWPLRAGCGPPCCSWGRTVMRGGWNADARLCDDVRL